MKLHLLLILVFLFGFVEGQNQTNIVTNKITDSIILVKLNKIDNEINNNKFKINELMQKDSLLSKELDISLSIFEKSSTVIGNQLSANSTLIGWASVLLALFGIFLGLYVNDKHQSIKKLLEEAQEAKRKQEEATKKIIAIKDAIDNDLTSLYEKLKKEEKKDILKKIDENTNQIQSHLHILFTLDIEENWLFFKDKLINETEYNNRKLFLLLLVEKFPSKMSANQEIKNILLYNWDSICRSIRFDSLDIFFKNYLQSYIDKKYQDIDDDFVKIVEGLENNYNPVYIAETMLFSNIAEKEKHYELLSLLQNKNRTQRVLSHYKNCLEREYNTPSQIE